MVQLVGTVEHPETVIRLRVGYRSVQSLVTEYTASLARGGCLLVTRKAVSPGARFLFEMACDDVDMGAPLLVEGEVVRVRPVNAGCEAYELAVRYRSSPSTRAALDVLLASIEVDTNFAVVREAPRIPVNLPAEDSLGVQRYVVRDVARGGMRIECARGSCQVTIGDRVLIGVHPAMGRKVFIGGTVRWAGHHPRGGELQFGVRFDELRDPQDPRRLAIDSLVQLERPSQVLVHIVDFKSKQANRMRGARRCGGWSPGRCARPSWSSPAEISPTSTASTSWTRRWMTCSRTRRVWRGSASPETSTASCGCEPTRRSAPRSLAT
ncbi:MAG: PilZ domain-containing protein [Myxococcales bacterium]|nr:PilZ domain-containing protein [Myxococcales bacterium]